MLIPLFLQALFLIIPLSTGLDCGDGKIRGVNLGGWLVLEPWITPVLFEEVNTGENEGLIVDEYTYAQYVDPVYYEERLDSHFDTYITKDYLETLNNAGVNYLRIPVGYWMFDVADDEPFPPPPVSDDEGRRFYLKRLIGWCEELGMRVMMDLHGAPGSQNGFDNSGQRGDPNWYDPNDSSNIDRTYVILEMLSDMMISWIDEGFMSEQTLYGVEVLNEPAGYFEDIWTECRDDFYPNAYTTLRYRFPDSDKYFVTIQNAFRNGSEFYDYMPEIEGYYGVSLDMHVYHGFDEYWNQITNNNPNHRQVHLDETCAYINEVEGQNLDTFTGEWSLAITDCQKYVSNGYATPYVPPYATPETCEYYNSDWSTYDDEYKQFLREFFLAQLDSAEAGKGFFFWTAHTENNCAPEWDLVFLIENGIAPSNFCDRETYCT